MRDVIPRLKLVRWKEGLTQRALAQKAGLPTWKISEWETGRRLPTLSEADAVQRAVGVDFSVLNPLDLALITKGSK